MDTYYLIFQYKDGRARAILSDNLDEAMQKDGVCKAVVAMPSKATGNRMRIEAYDLLFDNRPAAQKDQTSHSGETRTAGWFSISPKGYRSWVGLSIMWAINLMPHKHDEWMLKFSTETDFHYGWAPKLDGAHDRWMLPDDRFMY